MKGLELPKIVSDLKVHIISTLMQIQKSADSTLRISIFIAPFTFCVKAGFQHADFSASAEFFACADFSAFLHSNFHHNADCFKIKILEDLDKTKIIKHEIFDNGLQNKFVVTKINVLLLTPIYRRKKRRKQQRKRKM